MSSGSVSVGSGCPCLSQALCLSHGHCGCDAGECGDFTVFPWYVGFLWKQIVSSESPPYFQGLSLSFAKLSVV